MMTWRSVAGGKNGAAFEATVGNGPDAVPDALVEAWRKAFSELAGQCAEGTWDILICQLITQCGGVVIFPSRKNAGEADDASFTVHLLIEPWSRAYEELPDPDNESRFNKAYDRLHKSQIRAVKTALGIQI